MQFPYQVWPSDASSPVTCHTSEVKDILSRANVLWTEVVSLWIEKNGTVQWRSTSNPPSPPIPPPVPRDNSLNVLNTMRALRTESKGLNAFVSQARLRRSKRSSDIKCISKYIKKFGDQQRSCMFDHSMLRNFPKTFAKVFKSVKKTFLVGQFWSVYLGRVCCSPGPTSFWSLWRSCAG